jgi:hypothetical protein
MFTNFSSQTQQAQQTFKTMLEQQLQTLTTVSEEIARLEQTGLTVASAAIDDSTKLVKESLGAAAKAGGAVRQAAQETKKHAWDDAMGNTVFADGLNAFRKLAEEQTGRMAALQDEIGRFETEGRTRAEGGVEEYGRLLKESLKYGVQVSGEWRKLALEATRRVAEIITPTA